MGRISTPTQLEDSGPATPEISFTMRSCAIRHLSPLAQFRWWSDALQLNATSCEEKGKEKETEKEKGNGKEKENEKKNEKEKEKEKEKRKKSEGDREGERKWK